MEGIQFEAGQILTALLAVLSLVGSTVTLIFTRRERAARIEKDEAEARQKEAGAAQHIGDAAAATVETMLRVQDKLKEELYETKIQLENAEERMNVLQESTEALLQKSRECVKENISLMEAIRVLEQEKRDIWLEKEQAQAQNEELARKVGEFEIENRHLKRRITELEHQVTTLEKHLGLT